PNDPPPPVLWERGGNRLLVLIGGVHAKPGHGFVDVIVPVQCDELTKIDRGSAPATGGADVTVTFVTGSPDRPAGALAVTEDRPRGPAVVVEVWHEQLIAFAWHTFVRATAALAHIGAPDVSGRDLITVAITATPREVTVQPMARHISDRFTPRAEVIP